MVTKIRLSVQELADLKELTKQTDPEAALRLAMQDYLRYARRLQLKRMSGQLHRMPAACVRRAIPPQ